MRRYHCLFLWLGVLLWYASTPAIARAQSPPDRETDFHYRIGVQAGLSMPSNTSRFFGTFTNGAHARFTAEYGKQSAKTEWNVNASWMYGLIGGVAVAKDFGLYNNGVMTIPTQPASLSVSGYSLSIGGKTFARVPEDYCTVFYFRGYVGMQVARYPSFSVSIPNTAPRADTTIYINGESRIMPFLGLTPGFDFRAGTSGISLEFLGVQFHPDYGTWFHFLNISLHLFY